MTTSGTYGDELTLRAVQHIFNVELTIVSTLLKDGRLLIAPINSIARARLTLSHLVLERNQDYFEETLTDEYERVNDPTNNELGVIKVSLIRDNTRKEWEKKRDEYHRLFLQNVW